MGNTPHIDTRTDQRWYALYTALICLALGAAGAAGMWLWLRIPGPALLVGGVCVFMAAIMAPVLSRQNNFTLYFADSKLDVIRQDGEYYDFYDIPASDFRCSQNFLEKARNVGRIQIRGTMFTFYGVQNYSEVCRYIRENFPAK